VEALGETWSRIDSALLAGNRGLPSGSSLALLLANHRGIRNPGSLPDLTEEQILAWAAQALRLAAQSLHHSQGALGGFLRRMKGRLGAPAALTATAHKLARIVYLALKHGMTYVRQSQQEYEAQMKEKQIKALRRKARLLGLEVVEQTSASVPTAAAASAQG
jgi:hypothetical protein